MKGENRCHCRRRSTCNEVSERMTGRYKSRRPERNIYIYISGDTLREGKGKELREKEGRDAWQRANWSILYYTMATDQSTLSRPLLARTLGLSSPASFSPPSLSLRSKATIPKSSLAGLSTPYRIAEYIPTRTFPVGFRIAMRLLPLASSFLKHTVSRSDRENAEHFYVATPIFLLNWDLHTIRRV